MSNFWDARFDTLTCSRSKDGTFASSISYSGGRPPHDLRVFLRSYEALAARLKLRTASDLLFFTNDVCVSFIVGGAGRFENGDAAIFGKDSVEAKRQTAVGKAKADP